MNDQKLREMLEQLHGELEQAHAVEPATRDLLQHLARDIQGALQQSSPQRYSTLGKRLRDSMQHLEETHPNLVLTIGRVLDHLAQV
jgi:hypothetical protein